MNIVPFVVKKANQKKGIEGVLVQFDNNNARITFEDFLDAASESIFELNPEGKIENPSNFIASFVQRISPDVYKNVIVDGNKTKIIHTEDVKKETTRVIYRANGYDFDDLNQVVLDNNGTEVFLSELLSFEKIEVPVQANYTKDPLLNKVLAHNNVPFDVDRNFIRVLSSTVYRMLETMDARKTDKILVSVSKHAKKGFTLHMEKPKKKSSAQLYLEIKRSFFK